MLCIAEIEAFSTPIVAALAAFFGIWQYRKQNRQKRAEMFFRWNQWFDSAKGFGLDPKSEKPSMLDLLERDDSRLAVEQDVPWEKKEKLLAFYEEITLAVNSKLLEEKTACYMFGYYAVKIRNSKYFWKNLDEQDKEYWKLFNHFSKLSAKHLEKFKEANFNVEKLKF